VAADVQRLGAGGLAPSKKDPWPLRETSGRVEDGVWPLLKLFADRDYVDRFVKEDITLAREHYARIANGVIQAREYFHAASHTSLATAPTLLYYGMLHLADALIASRGGSQSQNHGLRRLRGALPDDLDYFGCKVDRKGAFASLNEVVNCDVSPVLNPLGRSGVVFWSTMTVMADELPTRGNIVGSTVNFWELVGAIPELHEYCIYSDRVICLTVPLHEIKLERRPPTETTLTLAFARGLEEYVSDYLVSRVGMERWIEGVDLVGYRHVSQDPEGSVSVPRLRSPLRGQPHLIFPQSREWQVSEIATMLLSMFILGDLARYQTNLWMSFIKRPSVELEAVSAFVDVALPKFPFLVLNHLRREYLHFTE
jgi:hypothetical protein